MDLTDCNWPTLNTQGTRTLEILNFCRNIPLRLQPGNVLTARRINGVSRREPPLENLHHSLPGSNGSFIQKLTTFHLLG